MAERGQDGSDAFAGQTSFLSRNRRFLDSTIRAASELPTDRNPLAAGAASDAGGERGLLS